jgi:outer membrane protein
MRKRILALTMILLMAGFSFGQKYAFVDTEYILNNIPEYTDAQDLLDDLSTEWQKEIETKFAEIDKLYKDYQAESILLPDEIKTQKENEIVQKEKEAKELQKKRFGKDGDLFKKRVELVQPIQEKVYNAIEEIATTRNFAFIFDKASGSSILYADEKLDLSDDVLDEIGSVMQTVKREDRVRSNYQPSSTSTSKQPTVNTQKQTDTNQQQKPGSDTPPPPGGRK